MAPIDGRDIVQQLFILLMLLQQILLYPLLNLEAEPPAPAPPAPKPRRKHTVFGFRNIFKVWPVSL